MIATWMFAATALALLAGAMALCIEYSARLMNRQGRGAWIIALVVTCAWPLAAPVALGPREQAAVIRPTSSSPVAVAVNSDLVITPAPSLRTRLGAFDRPLLVTWGAISLALLVHALLAMRSLRRLARRAESGAVSGRSVLLTPSIGPAAFGVFRPRIVLPKWALDLDASLRDLVLRHEVEHVNSADPAVLTLAWLLAVLFPWNAGLWWIVRRLRTATELDCDRRVLRAGADSRRYAHLLLLIAQRQGKTAFASLIAGSPTTLPLRIAAMHSAPPTRRTLRATASALIALALGAVTASPVLARELASVRDWTPTAPDALSRPSLRPPLAQSDGPRVLPTVTTVAARPLTPPAPLAQDSTKKPSKRVEVITRTSIPAASKGSTTVPNDAPVVPAPGSAAPRYPEILKLAGVTGVTVVQFVVDTTGSPIPSTLKVVRSSHALFTQAVQKALPGANFLPARAGGRNVKQLAQMVYRFDLQGTPATDTLPAPYGSVPTFTVVITAIVPK